MANYLATDTDLTTVANAIRSKGNTSAALAFPTGMKNAIDALNVGTGLSPAAGAADIRNGKKAVVNRTTITGSMTEKAAATYNTSTSDQSVAANQYLTGAQTIKAVTTSNIDAGNIKSGVTIKVGDANNAGRIKNVTGSYGPVTQDYYAYLPSATTVAANSGIQLTLRLTDSNSSTTITSHKPIAISKIKTNSFMAPELFMNLLEIKTDGTVVISVTNSTAYSIPLEAGYYARYSGIYMA